MVKVMAVAGVTSGFNWAPNVGWSPHMAEGFRGLGDMAQFRWKWIASEIFIILYWVFCITDHTISLLQRRKKKLLKVTFLLVPASDHPKE